MTIVRVADDLSLHGVRIAIAREREDGQRWVAKIENGQVWAWEPVPEGAVANPTLLLDFEVATALSAALADHFAGKSADRHLTAGELAERLSVPPEQVGQWEAGRHRAALDQGSPGHQVPAC